MIERSRVRVPAGAAGDISSPGSTVCADAYFSICSTPVLLLLHVKDPSHLLAVGPGLILQVQQGTVFYGSSY